MAAPFDDVNPVRKTYFLNESEKSATPTDDQGKVPQLEENGHLSTKLGGDSLLLVAGEEIAAEEAVMIGTGTDNSVFLTVESGVTTQSITNTTWVAQKFRTGPTIRDITAIAFKMSEKTNTTLRFSIRSTLTGPDLAYGDLVTGVSASSSVVFRGATLTAPFALSPNTDYFVILRRTAGGGGGDFTPTGDATSSYADGEAYVSTNSGSTWNPHGSIADFNIQLTGGVTEAGKAYKASNTIPNLFCGFASADVEQDDELWVQIHGVTPKAGVTLGLEYYLSTVTRGAISTSGTKKVGLAVSTDAILIKQT